MSLVRFRFWAVYPLDTVFAVFRGFFISWDYYTESEVALYTEMAQRRAEIEKKKAEENRVKSVPKLEKPQLTAPIVTIIISALCFLLGVSELNKGSKYCCVWIVRRN